MDVGKFQVVIKKNRKAALERAASN